LLFSQGDALGSNWRTPLALSQAEATNTFNFKPNGNALQNGAYALRSCETQRTFSVVVMVG